MIRDGLLKGPKLHKKFPSEYWAWSGAKGRCLRKTCKDYPGYGGRGIRMCVRWLHSFANFLSDMGRRPSRRHSLDRIDVNGHYEPGNCRWATTSQQARNTRFTKLTAEAVREIRSDLSVGLSQSVVARKYKVSQALIWSIANGRLWRDVK